MILAIDIGNTNTVLGGMEGSQLLFMLRIRSDPLKTAAEYMLTIKGLLELKDVDPAQIEGGIISSVVPELKNVMGRAMEELTGKQFLVVGSGIKTGLNIKMDNPGQLGADLVVDAVAALSKYKPPLVFFDMGTATTLSVIDKKSNYIGGMIIPGLRLSVDALSAKAAQLPYINLNAPEQLIGTNTIACMQAGAIYSNAAMIDGLLERVEEALGEPVTAVATGGLMATVLPYCKRTIHYDENLMLEGLRILYQKNCSRKKQ
ncbi:MAG: type III pantothenate kinase [Oscillospiraceae bacterium]|nr:type III pantothenate kinase [Oscillospiraceae bacterium]